MKDADEAAKKGSALGSVRAVTDASGALVTRDYYPYWEEWNEPASVDSLRFTGKEENDDG